MTPSLSFDWHDNPPQEVRACSHNILCNALSALIFLLYVIVAFPHVRACPYAEPSRFPRICPNNLHNHFTSPHCVLSALAQVDSVHCSHHRTLFHMCRKRRLVCFSLLPSSAPFVITRTPGWDAGTRAALLRDLHFASTETYRSEKCPKSEYRHHQSQFVDFVQ